MRQGSGPYYFSCLFPVLCLGSFTSFSPKPITKFSSDISLTTAPLVPSASYTTGRSVLLILAIHSGLALFFSVVLFPQTVSKEFEDRLREVLGAVGGVLAGERSKLKDYNKGDESGILGVDYQTSGLQSSSGSVEEEEEAQEPESPSRTPQSQNPPAYILESTLLPLEASARLLPSDLSFSRFAPEDLLPLQGLCRRIVGRCLGMGRFWTLIEPGSRGLSGGEGKHEGEGDLEGLGGQVPNPMSRATSRPVSQAPSVTHLPTSRGHSRLLGRVRL